MNFRNPFLALIGHGTTGKDTTGKDDIERGIHLRWQFRREMGFPLGGFYLYRRRSGEYGTPVCFAFKKFRVSEKRKPFHIGPKKRRVKILSSLWPLALESRQVRAGRRRTNLERVLVIPDAELMVTLPECAYRVTVRAVVKARSRLTLVAYADGVEVGRSTISARSAGARSVTVQASAMDTVILRAHSVALVQVCYLPCERCEKLGVGGWERIVKEPICLPIHYPGKPVKEPHRDPGIDWLSVEDRLPKDPSIHGRYGSESAKELASVLKTLVDPQGLTAHAEQLIEATTLAVDCPPPDQEQPSIRFPAIDAVLMAAIDPIVARELGLYFIDRDVAEGVAFDYKIEGDWPKGTLWHLSKNLNFDSFQVHRRFFLNIFPIGQLIFRVAIRPTVVDKPSKTAGTNQALAFFETDDFDWNLPPLDNLPIPRFQNPTVEIRFPQPVGEVQIYLGQNVPNVILEAWDDSRNRQVTKPVLSTRREDVLAVHGDLPTDQITSIVLKGNDFWLYKVCWQMERIPHDKHCGFVYGLKKEPAESLAAPAKVSAFPLPGVVKKVADCQPLMEGETLDARYSVGVTLNLPLVQDRLLPRSVIRYNIRRIRHDGETELLTEDTSIFITPPSPEFKATRLRQLPVGWPKDQPHFIDSGLEPGKYQYQAAGIDLFGRASLYSESSETVEPVSPPPPTPTNVSAYFIDHQDSWLSTEDRDALPDGVGEAIRLRWNWPKQFDRISPDVEHFNVHYVQGIPNVLLGEIMSIDQETNDRVVITAHIRHLETAPQNLLAGRLLTQNGKAFRILSHGVGSSHESGQKITIELRLPNAPSRNRPIVSQCSIVLNASIPVEVKDLAENVEGVTATLRTSAFRASPPSGLQHGSLTLDGGQATIKEVIEDALVDDKFQIKVRLGFSDPTQKDRILGFTSPFFAKLTLFTPSTDAFKEYSRPDAWPTDFNATIPKIAVGQYDLLIRRAAQGEKTGLTSTDPGAYVLVVDELPTGLDVDLDNPRREGHFGVSCFGPGGQGPVSFSAEIARIYRGDKAKQDEVLSDLKPPIVPEDFVLEGPPNFEGKLTYEFSWKATLGWRYEVHRTLDDTLFKVDKSIREAIETGKSPARFPDAQERQQWLDIFPSPNQSSIESLVIDSTVLDLAAIENRADRNILLQALASLPFNDRAFTRLDLDREHLRQDEIDPSKMICIDETIEGKAKGRYFYRVQAFDSVGNPASMAISTRPIYVKGVIGLTAPVITKILGGDRHIKIRWASSREPQLAEYRIYRTDREEAARDLRLMTLVHTKVVPPGDPAARSAEAEWVDRHTTPLVIFYYRIVAADEEGNPSLPSDVISAGAYHNTPPDPPTWTRAEWVLLDENGIEQPWGTEVPAGQIWSSVVALSWTSSEPDQETIPQRRPVGAAFWRSVTTRLPAGQYLAYDRGADLMKGTYYRLKVWDSAGNQNDYYDEFYVPPPT